MGMGKKSGLFLFIVFFLAISLGGCKGVEKETSSTIQLPPPPPVQNVEIRYPDGDQQDPFCWYAWHDPNNDFCPTAPKVYGDFSVNYDEGTETLDIEVFQQEGTAAHYPMYKLAFYTIKNQNQDGYEWVTLPLTPESSMLPYQFDNVEANSRWFNIKGISNQRAVYGEKGVAIDNFYTIAGNYVAVFFCECPGGQCALQSRWECNPLTANEKGISQGRWVIQRLNNIESEEIELFSDSFLTGTADFWDFGSIGNGICELAHENGNYYMSCQDFSWFLTKQSKTWSDYIVNVDVRIHQNAAGIWIGNSIENDYYLLVSKDHIRLGYEQEDGTQQELHAEQIQLNQAQWYKITVKVLDNIISVFVDDQITFSEPLNEELKPSQLIIETGPSEQNDFDNILITCLKNCPMQNFDWTKTSGPEGGEPTSIVIDYTNSNLVYSGHYDGSIYKSTDGGNTWEYKINGLTRVRVTDVVMDPVNPSILYAAASGELFKSIDRAESWIHVLRDESELHNRFVNKITIAPSDPNRLYLAISSGLGTHNPSQGEGDVLKSSDGGTTWTETHLDKDVLSVAVHPTNPDIVIAGTLFDGIYKSSDGGTTWIQVNNGLLLTTPHAWVAGARTIKYSITNNQKVFATLGGFFYRSDDGGDTWNRIGQTQYGDNTFGGFDFDRSTSELYTHVGSSIVKTSDYGNTFIQVGTASPTSTTLTIDPSNPDTMFIGSEGSKVLKSDDRGITWNVFERFMAALWIHRVAIHPTNYDIVYAGSLGKGLFKSVDAGDTWQQIGDGLGEEQGIHEITIDHNNPDTIYVGVGTEGIWKSEDGGDTWEDMTNNIIGSPSVTDIAIHPTDSNTVYISTGDKFGTIPDVDGGVFKSTNGGQDWVKIDQGFTHFEGLTDDIIVTEIEIDPVNPNNIYVTTYGGFYKTNDGGTTWTKSNTGINYPFLHTLTVDPVDPQTLYVGAQDLYLHVREEACFLTDPECDIHQFDGADRDIWKSTDRGDTWEPLHLSLMGGGIERIVVNPTNNEEIFVGLHAPGAFMSKDGGDNWFPINQGLVTAELGTHMYVFGLDISNDGSRLYTGSCGRSVYRADLTRPPSLFGEAAGSDIAEESCKGCSDNGQCIELGEQRANSYCDIDKLLKDKKMKNEVCKFNYECESNNCKRTSDHIKTCLP
jgi:photosystem II stability/assembly factor-like uncharacterized protein